MNIRTRKKVYLERLPIWKKAVMQDCLQWNANITCIILKYVATEIILHFKAHIAPIRFRFRISGIYHTDANGAINNYQSYYVYITSLDDRQKNLLKDMNFYLLYSAELAVLCMLHAKPYVQSYMIVVTDTCAFLMYAINFIAI